MNKRFLLIAVPAFVLLFSGARSTLWYRYANIVLRPDAVNASSEYPAEENFNYVASNTLDGDYQTAWFNRRSDAVPSITYAFDEPVVIQAVDITNGWIRDWDNWNANSRARDVRFEFSDGLVIERTLLDEMHEQTFQFQDTVIPEDRPASWMKITITSSYSGSQFSEIGLTDVKILGRRYFPDDLLFEELASCTVTFEKETTIRANRPTGRVEYRPKEENSVVYLFGDEDNRSDHRGYNIEVFVRPPDTSSSDRIVRVGRSFEVINVESIPDEAMVLHCADGTLIGLSTSGYGSPQSPFGELSMSEMNHLLDGVIEFSDYHGRQTSDY